MAIGGRSDPYGGYNFLVEIEGITRASFQECSGLDSTQTPNEYREGTDPLTTRKLPGLVTYSNITLRWGITDDAELWEWRKSVANGNVESKNISIILLDDTGSEKIRWNVLNCWPTAWVGPSLNRHPTDLAL